MKMIEKILSALAIVTGQIITGLKLSKPYTIDEVLTRTQRDPFVGWSIVARDPFLTNKTVTDWYQTNIKARYHHNDILYEIKKW